MLDRDLWMNTSHNLDKFKAEAWTSPHAPTR